MDWIKKNYDQAVLALIALVLLSMSVWLLLMALNFDATFQSLKGESAHNNTIKPLELTAINHAKEAMEKPSEWATHPGSLFVSEKYLIKDGVPVNPLKSDIQLHPPVPNSWFNDNNLPILDNTVLTDDPDGDGFSNLEEYNVKTNPQDKTSHPAYFTKLRLVRAIQQPFRLLFPSYDGDPKKPESLTFQINTLDVHQPTLFLKLNEQIPKTKFKIVGFELKNAVNAATGTNDDVSELTVQNIETGDKVVLVLTKIANSPDSYALFKYLWDGSQFPVKKDKTFTLKPEDNVVYKLIDIKDTEAQIESAKGEKITVPKLEQ